MGISVALRADSVHFIPEDLTCRHYLGWKFPGGASEPGESIFETAAREVFEETGVKAAPKAVLYFE